MGRRNTEVIDDLRQGIKIARPALYGLDSPEELICDDRTGLGRGFLEILVCNTVHGLHRLRSQHVRDGLGMRRGHRWGSCDAFGEGCIPGPIQVTRNTRMSFEKGTIEEGRILCKMDRSQSSINCLQLSGVEHYELVPSGFVFKVQFSK